MTVAQSRFLLKELKKWVKKGIIKANKIYAKISARGTQGTIKEAVFAVWT